jgi:multicomponent Na+:H+ antiporter subunit B
MEALVDLALLTMLAVLAIGIVRLRSLFGAAMLFGIYSLLCALIFVVLDAVDVAFTEAAVGAGISTILILSTLSITGAKLEVKHSRPLMPLLICIATGAALIYASLDMPLVGDPLAPANLHIAPEYIEGTRNDVQMPNVVTAVLASYRGYDTLGEVTVIFTAGVAVLCLFSRRRRRRSPPKES